MTPFSFERTAGFAVHLFTASGAGIGLLSLLAAFEGRFAAMFGWLGFALAIDGIDGTFARMAKVKETAPEIDGDALDLVVDFLTYVVVPAVALLRGNLLPPDLAMPLTFVMAVCSALYFADRRMKTHDFWFRGFPALWNVLVLYLFMFRLPPMFNAIVVLVATVLLFAPVTFVHPLRVRRFRVVTLLVTALFVTAAIAAVTNDLQPSLWVRSAFAGSALYYLVLSFWRGRSTA